MMNSRFPFYAAFFVSLFACGDSYDYSPPPNAPEPVIAQLPNDCVNPTVRNELGTETTGLKTIRIRARIAQNSLGALALEDETQIVNDIHVLNTRFASSNLRFVLDDIEVLPRDEALYKLTGSANPLCNEQFKPLAEDSIPMLYVANIVLATGQARGMANACGAVINARTRSSEFEDISGTFSNVEAVPRMMGYVLGLLQTNACYNVQGYENDPQLSGDLVADTSFDPGLANVMLQCGGTTAPGKCVFVDEATCEIQCSDGSLPDVHNIMSLYTGCRDQFSEGQFVYMRCAVELHHSQAKCNNVWATDLGKNVSGSEGIAHIADVDGDGNADAIIFRRFSSPATWRVALSTGSEFAPSAIWNEGFGENMVNTIQRELVADVDGDKKADAVLKSNDTWLVALSTGASFATPSVWIEEHGGLPLLGDVNADGKADAVTIDSTGSWSVALSTGSAFAAPTAWIKGYGGGDSYTQALGDVDGDGKADAVTFTTYTTQDFETVCKWDVARSTGTAFGNAELWYGEKCSDKLRWRLGDVDGDKKVDLVVFRYEVSSWFVHLSTGAGFGPRRLGIGGLGLAEGGGQHNPVPFVGDMDGDKKADFVSFDEFRGIWTTSLCRPEGSVN